MTPSTPDPSTAGNLLIRASAGTGKTYQLASRYIEKLEHSLPDRMLATTFTRKAAGEILERILLRLASDRPPESGDTAGNHDPYRLLTKFTRNLHRAHIGTLDSFFINVASAIALELGIPSGWRIIDELEQEQFRLRAVETLLQEESTSDVMRLMHMLSKGDAGQRVTDELLDAVREFHDLYLMTDRSAWFRVTAPSGLPKSDLRDALDALNRVVVPQLKTWKEAHEESQRDAQANRWPKFLGQGIAKVVDKGESRYRSRAIPPEVVAAYEPLVRHARAVVLGELADRNAATWELLRRFDEAWSALAREHRFQTFSQITLRLARYFHERNDAQSEPGSSFDSRLQILDYRIDSQVEQLLLDEFQDTSVAQWQALVPWARQAAARAPGGFFCVGDGKQAIYSWRAGRSELFAHLEQAIPGLELHELNQSRRSAQPIIDIVNEVFLNALRHDSLKEDERAAVAKFSATFPKHETVETFPGYAAMVHVEPPPGTPLSTAINERVVGIVRQVQVQAPGCSIGILVRKNKTLAPLVYALRKDGIDASEEGGTPLTDSAGVQLMLSALTLVDHPGDKVARFHVVHSPLAVTFPPGAANDSDAVCRWAAEARARLVEHGYSSTLSAWIELLRSSCDDREEARLRQLVEMADGFQSLATLRTADFVRFVEQKKMESPGSCPVRVMTVHQAKGLQFDVTVLAELQTSLSPERTPVFVTSEPDPFDKADGVCLYVDADVQRLLPPDVREMFAETTRRSVREALCLLYVAMTRAKRAMYLVCGPATTKKGALLNNYAALIRAALNCRDAPPDNMVARGDPNWFEALPDELRRPRRLQASALSDPIRFRPASPDEMRARGRVSPSQKPLAGKVRLSRILQSAKRETLDRAALIHAWFESIAWLDEGRPSRESLEQIARDAGATPADVAACLGRFQSMLTRPEVIFALSRSSYIPPTALQLPSEIQVELAAEPLRLEVERERRFVIREGASIMSGAIDRLILMHRGNRLIAVDILDFKTDAPTLSLNEKEQRREQYRGQLASYARAVAGIFQIAENRISTRLVMLGAGRVEPVDWRQAAAENTTGEEF